MENKIENNKRKNNSFKKIIEILTIIILSIILINIGLYFFGKPNLFTLLKNNPKIEKTEKIEKENFENENTIKEDKTKISISNEIKLEIEPFAMNEKILLIKYKIEGKEINEKIYSKIDFEEDIEKYIETENTEPEEETIEEKEEIKQRLIEKGIEEKQANKIIEKAIKTYKNNPTEKDKEEIKEEIATKLKEEITLVGRTKINGKEIKIDRQKLEKNKKENNYILYTLYNLEELEELENKNETKTEDEINEAEKEKTEIETDIEFDINIDSIAKEIGDWKFNIKLDKKELEKEEIIKEIEKQYNQKINPLLKQGVEKIISKYNGDVSVYFKDLKTNESFEINNKKMYPCSTIKSFVLATAVEEIHKGNIQLTQNFETYLRQMIIISDNNAYNHCIQNIGKGNPIEGLNKVTNFAKKIGATNTICRHALKPSNMKYFQSTRGLNESTAKDTAILFEKLYRGEIVSKEVDQKMLDLLAKCDDDDELKRGLPKDVVFSHKTGCAYAYYHDVGIVYTPKRDYIISVFQDKVVNHQKMMKEISEYIYKEEIKLK